MCVCVCVCGCVCKREREDREREKEREREDREKERDKERERERKRERCVSRVRVVRGRVRNVWGRGGWVYFQRIVKHILHTFAPCTNICVTPPPTHPPTIPLPGTQTSHFASLTQLNNKKIKSHTR